MNSKDSPENGHQERLDFVREAEQRALEKIMRDRGCSRDAAIRLLNSKPKYPPAERALRPLPED